MIRKRITAMIAAFALIMTLTACNGNNASVPENDRNMWESTGRVMEIAKTPDKNLKLWDVLPEIPETPAAELEYAMLADGSGLDVSGYKGTGNAVRIPETIDGTKVVSIRFSEVNIEELILPTTVEYARVYNCPIKYLNVPCDEIKIQMSYDLEKVYIEDNVTVISSGLFAREELLTQVRMGSSLKVIEGDAFQGCEALRELEIPEGVEYIGDAFRYTNFTKLTLPSSLVALHKEAFVLASNDTVIEYNGKSYSRGDDELFRQFYPNDLLIYNNVVVDCRSYITEVNIPEGVTEIGDYALAFERDIVKITLPKSLRIIHDGAFNSCEALTEIVIPEGVEELGALVFEGCKSLKKIDLPDSLTAVELSAFADISYTEEHGFTDFEVTYKGVTYTSSEEDIRELLKQFERPADD